MLFKDHASPHISGEKNNKIKANFLEQEMRQMQSYIEDLEMSCQTNKEILQALIKDRDDKSETLTYTIEKLTNENQILSKRLQESQRERDDSQAQLLIQKQINANDGVKEAQMEQDFKEKIEEYKELIERKEYQIQNQEHRYTELERFLQHISENDPTISQKLKEMKIQLSKQGKITNVVEQNQHLKAELDLARLESSRFKIRLQNVERNKTSLQKKFKEVQSQSFVMKFDNSFGPQTQGNVTNVPMINLSSMGSNMGATTSKETQNLKLPPRVPVLALEKVKKVEPKKNTYQYIKKLEDSIKLITNKNKELEDENFELQDENKSLLETNNNLYEYGEKTKVQLEKAHQRIKHLEQKLIRLQSADSKNRALRGTHSERGSSSYYIRAAYLKSEENSHQKEDPSFGNHEEISDKNKIDTPGVSPIRSRPNRLPPSGKSQAKQRAPEMRKDSQDNEKDQDDVPTREKEFINGMEQSDPNLDYSNVSLPESFAEKDLSIIKGFGVEEGLSDPSDHQQEI